MADNRARALRRSMTPQEVKRWVHLRTWKNKGFHFRRQAPQHGYIVDFLCLKHHFVVEIDGGQHGHQAHAVRDMERDARLTEEGFRILRFWNSDVDRDISGVLDTILAALVGLGTPPTMLRMVPPPRSGEG